MRRTISPETRFLSHLAEPNEFGCRLWIGATSVGYGSFSIQTGKRIGAHVYAYKRAYGAFDPHLSVCHKCDVFYPPHDLTYRACCEPTHLFVGTRSDNTQDSLAKGRHNKMMYDLSLIIECPICHHTREVCRAIARNIRRGDGSQICRSCAAKARVKRYPLTQPHHIGRWT